MYTKGTGLDCPLCKKDIEIGNCLDVESMNKLNSHKDLLEACKEALRWHKGDKWRMSQDEEQVRAWNQTDHKLEQAINKAEGKA